MRCEIYDERGIELLRVEERTPECGEAFCDRCGDCLACYGDVCPEGCRWVVYEGDEVPLGELEV